MKPHKVTVDNHGLFAMHDMPCAIYYDDEKSAVIDCQTGVFQPSRKAQEEGWRLVKARTKFQKFLLSTFFK